MPVQVQPEFRMRRRQISHLHSLLAYMGIWLLAFKGFANRDAACNHFAPGAFILVR